MPSVGIVRGFGEGYIATGYVIKLIKALNRRFRSKITFEELVCGDYIKHGSSLSFDVIKQMGNYDTIYMGDMYSVSNPLEYTFSDIAYSLGDNIQYTCVSGFDKWSGTDIAIASYFDGGARMRETSDNRDGCVETRVCSSFAMKNIAKHVIRHCETRRRRLAFVKDGDIEYCANGFYRAFENFALPLSNFKLIRFTPRDICREMMYAPRDFDVIFASDSFSEAVLGMFEFMMKESFAFYYHFGSDVPVYALRATGANSASGDYTPSLCSYIIALSDMLKNEFDMAKEAAQLRLAIDYAVENGATSDKGEEFVSMVIEGLRKDVTTKYSKRPPSRYIR